MHFQNSHQGEKMKDRVIKFIMNSDITLLTFFSALIPLALLVIWALIIDKVFNDQLPQSVRMFVLLLCMPTWGLGGLFQVMKKEAPGVMGKTIKGWWAILSGVLLMILFWGLSIVSLYFYIVEFVIGK